MQASGHRWCSPTSVRSMSRVPLLCAAFGAQRSLRNDLHIVDGLVSVTRRAWGLGLRVDERAGA